MTGEFSLIPEKVRKEEKFFEFFEVGEGYISARGNLRLKIDFDTYLHFCRGQIECNCKEDWPLEVPVEVKKFKLIAEEI